MLTQEKKTPVDRELDSLFAQLQTLDPVSDEYASVQDRVIKLYKMRAELDLQRSRRVSPDTVVLAATNLIGIFLIMHHEHLHPITTKATSLAIKPR